MGISWDRVGSVHPREIFFVVLNYVLNAAQEEARITELGGQLFRLEGDDEVWRMLEEDAFEWSAQYNDYLVHYYDSAEEDPETHTSVWQWLKSAMELVVGDSHESAEEEERAAASGSTGPGAGQGKRRRR